MGNSVTTASGGLPFVMTLIWAFTTGIVMTATAYRNDAFAYVSNRMSHHMSGFLFLLAASAIGGATAMLAGSIVKFISLFRSEPFLISSWGIFTEPMEFFTQMATAILYAILIGSVGYAIGAFIQRTKFVIPLLIVVLVVVPLFTGFLTFEILTEAAEFYGTEKSLPVFLLKVAVTVAGLFGFSALMTERLEVRK